MPHGASDAPAVNIRRLVKKETNAIQNLRILPKVRETHDNISEHEPKTATHELQKLHSHDIALTHGKNHRNVDVTLIRHTTTTSIIDLLRETIDVHFWYAREPMHEARKMRQAAHLQPH